jgi:hypothetical protein
LRHWLFAQMAALGTEKDELYTKTGHCCAASDTAGTRVRVRGGGYAGKRVRVQRVFSKKKLTGPSQTRTRLPAYTRARVRVPRARTVGTRVRVVPGGF